MRARLVLIGLLGMSAPGGTGCASDPPPKKEPRMCDQYFRDQDQVETQRECSDKDEDGDRVDDAVDLCPTTPETLNDMFDHDGCPDPDADKDMIADYDDGCPDEPGGFPDGCPQADADGDGIPDHLDACPSRKEDIDGERDADGCPEGDRNLLAGEQVVLLTEALLETKRGKASRTEQGARVLADIVEQTKAEEQNLVRIEIDGLAGLLETKRTRAEGLAQNRAEEVQAAFTSAGIPVSRFALKPEVLKGPDAKSTGGVRVRVYIAGQAPAAAGDGAAAASSPPATEGGAAGGEQPATTGGAKGGEQTTAQTHKPAASGGGGSSGTAPAAEKTGPGEGGKAAQNDRGGDQKPAGESAQTPPANDKPAEQKSEKPNKNREGGKSPPPGDPPPSKKNPPPQKGAGEDDWDAEVLPEG